MTLQKTVMLSCYSCENLRSQNVPCSTEGSHRVLVHAFHTNFLPDSYTKKFQSKLSPVAKQSKASVCSRSFAGTADSNPDVGVIFGVVCFTGRSLCDGLITCPEESY